MLKQQRADALASFIDEPICPVCLGGCEHGPYVCEIVARAMIAASEVNLIETSYWNRVRPDQPHCENGNFGSAASVIDGQFFPWRFCHLSARQ